MLPTVLGLNGFSETLNNKQNKLNNNVNHTAGVAGRNEIGQQHELKCEAIMKAILATAYKGYVAKELIAKSKNKSKSVQETIAICDV